ncbi:MAG: hypothetical protein ABI273_01170 [Lacunisphaera sp.]
MTLRTYIRLLRPFRTVLGPALFAFLATNGSFLGGVTLLPLLVGANLAFVAHEPMHHPFILLLPDSTRKLLRATAFTIFIVASGVATGAAFFEPTVSPAATFGLACALLALPCLDRRRLIPSSIQVAVVFCGWYIGQMFGGAHLKPAMVAAPWIFFGGGLAIAAASLARGFARSHLRLRSTTPIHPFIPLFDRRTAARIKEEFALTVTRRANSNPDLGRDWPLRSIGLATREWMQVLVHGSFGRRARSRDAKILAIVLIFGPLLLPLADQLLDFMPQRGNAPSYWDTLASFTGPLTSVTDFPRMRPSHFLSLFFQPGLAALIAIFILRPQIPYPISRDRLAKTEFGLSLFNLGLALTLPATLLFLFSLLGQFVTGHYWPDFGIRTVIGTNLLLVIALPLLQCGSWFPSEFERPVWSILLGVAFAVAVTFRDEWLAIALSGPGILVVIIAGGVVLALRWWTLRWHYRTSDLSFESSRVENTAR